MVHEGLSQLTSDLDIRAPRKTSRGVHGRHAPAAAEHDNAHAYASHFIKVPSFMCVIQFLGDLNLFGYRNARFLIGGRSRTSEAI
jgi:hypothetical protein